MQETIRVRSVQARAEGDDIGYIRITKFNGLTAEGLKSAIAELAAKIRPEALKGYVLDLRNNPGGVFDQAVAVAGSLLDDGLIASTAGREEADRRYFNVPAGASDLAQGKPIIVLVNGGTASS